jgi:HAD superfamily hydrolase (TIGR01509 family)
MPADLVIFDCDGVLIDSEPLSNRVLIESLNNFGLKLTYDEAIETFVGKSLKSNRTYIEERLGKPLPQDFIHTLEAKVIETFEKELQAIAGIHDALKSIVQPVCVASGSNPAWIRAALKVAGLLSYFDNNIFSASQVKHGKPAPDIFLFAAENMGFMPAQCAVVEDSPTGVQAGVAAGMKVLAYTGTFKSEQLKDAGAHIIFEDMKKLPSLLASQL